MNLPTSCQLCCHQAPILLAGTAEVVSHGSTPAPPSLWSVLPWHPRVLSQTWIRSHYSHGENSADFLLPLRLGLWRHLAYSMPVSLGRRERAGLLFHCFSSPYSKTLFFLHHFSPVFYFQCGRYFVIVTYLFVFKVLLFLFLFPGRTACYVHTCMLSRFNCVWLFMTLWAVACQALLSMGFSRQDYWSGLPCPPPRDLPDPGIKSSPLMFPALSYGFFTAGTNARHVRSYSPNQGSNPCPLY